MTDIVQDIQAIRATAEAGPIGKRQSSFELYGVLARCKDIAERCIANPDDEARIRQLIVDGPMNGATRAYVERNSDQFTVVCRFVFKDKRAGKMHYGNSHRYAIALRQAHERQIHSSALLSWLKENGGINALYFSRETANWSVTTKTLYLRKAITVQKGAEFTITLRREVDNSYSVLSP